DVSFLWRPRRGLPRPAFAPILSSSPPWIKHTPTPTIFGFFGSAAVYRCGKPTVLIEGSDPAAEEAGPANGFGFAPMTKSQNMNTSSPNESGIIHRETMCSYCGRSKDEKLFTG